MCRYRRGRKHAGLKWMGKRRCWRAETGIRKDVRKDSPGSGGV